MSTFVFFFKLLFFFKFFFLKNIFFPLACIDARPTHQWCDLLSLSHFAFWNSIRQTPCSPSIFHPFIRSEWNISFRAHTIGFGIYEVEVANNNTDFSPREKQRILCAIFTNEKKERQHQGKKGWDGKKMPTPQMMRANGNIFQAACGMRECCYYFATTAIDKHSEWLIDVNMWASGPSNFSHPIQSVKEQRMHSNIFRKRRAQFTTHALRYWMSQ